ncbi:MAG: bifunctional DNA primase/polymerase [Pseudonocardiaceae bacterium]
MSELVVPTIDEDTDTLTAALAYADCGWYVLPTAPRNKNPGSRVGAGWPAKSSRDPQQIAAWFAGSADGLALHVGRSGALVFDVDAPDALPEVLTRYLHIAPYQATRLDEPSRGHYVFSAPQGRLLGNSKGALSGGWGEVRGTNGIIVAAPSAHAHPDGRYRWLRTGPVPPLPDELAAMLPEASPATDAATDSTVRTFLTEHTSSSNPGLLSAVVSGFTREVRDGHSRHGAAVTAACWAMREAAAGYYPATEAANKLRAAFLHSVEQTRPGSGRVAGDPMAPTDWAGALAWAIGQARATDPATTRERVQASIDPAPLKATAGGDGASASGGDGGGGGGGGDRYGPSPTDVPPDDEKRNDDETTGSGKPSASTRLVQVAEELYEFGVSDSGETFGVPRCGPKVLRLLRGGKTSLRGQLTREYFRRYGKAAPAQALADALLVVEGIAQDSEEQTLHLRVAAPEGGSCGGGGGRYGPSLTEGGDVWLDLSDATGRAVAITAAGWTVQPAPPVLFKRTALMSALPEPARGADLAELWRWLNITEADRPLVAAWLAAVLFEDIPHPILSISGEQGTGKSTAEKVLVSILDPSPVPTRKPPRDAESWVTAAAGSWVVGLDNLSDIPPWLSDSLCRAVTGDGDVRRKLYTDGDMAVFSFRRCVVLNGIDLGALRGDLADRLLPVALDVIPEERRLPETELWPRWKHAHPQILGAVLDLVAGVKAALPSVELKKKPRMADFAQVLAAVDHVLGTAGLPRYLAKQAELATESLTDDTFISSTARKITSTFDGTSTDLLGRVSLPEGVRAPKGWPTTARQATQLLRRQAPVMRKAGWTIHDDAGHNKDGVLRWTITPPSTRDGPYPPPRHPQDPPSAFDLASGHSEPGGDGEGRYEPSLTEVPALNGSDPTTEAALHLLRSELGAVPITEATTTTERNEP